jgi:hypothetical protein
MPGESDGVVTDVDVLLHLTNTFRDDLAHLKTDQLAELKTRTQRYKKF